MLDLDLKHLIEQHPEVLTDHTKLKAYMLDLYPNCKRGMVNILVAIQKCGIVAEMQASKNPSTLDMGRWKKCLEDDFGFTGTLAETCLEMWCSAIGIQEKEKAKSTATSISPELQNSQKDWFEYDGTTLLRLKEEYQKYDGAIYVPYGVESIGKSAFKGCRSLTSIAIPDSVESIGDNAFWGCTGLTSITIPDSVYSIGDFAFRDCTGLTSITIPDSVTKIEQYVFNECQSLEKIIFQGTKAQWKAIEKYDEWNLDTGSYVVHCTDGDISKNES